MSIIKRKKQQRFFQMSNHATQEDLTSLQSIGLLAYIISLPHDWTLYKTQLQKKFTRRTVDNAWKELVEKKYIAGFSCYVDRKKAYYYIASDEVLTQSDFDTFIEETLEDIDGSVKNIQLIKDCVFSVARFVQHTEYSTPSAEPDVQVQMKQEKDIPQTHTNKDTSSVNTNDQLLEFIDSLFLEHGEGLFDKKDREYFSEVLHTELDPTVKDPERYLDSVVKNIVHRRKKKLGLVKTNPRIYDWLNA